MLTSQIGEDTTLLYLKRIDEGYDLTGVDGVFDLWKQYHLDVSSSPLPPNSQRVQSIQGEAAPRHPLAVPTVNRGQRKRVVEKMPDLISGEMFKKKIMERQAAEKEEAERKLRRKKEMEEKREKNKIDKEKKIKMREDRKKEQERKKKEREERKARIEEERKKKKEKILEEKREKAKMTKKKKQKEGDSVVNNR